MSSKPIPIYGKSEQGKSGYTIYFDMNSKKAFRGHHKELNSAKFWIGFFVFLIFMRGLAEINLPDTWFLKLIIIAVGIPLSIQIGKVLQRKSIEDLREIYLSEYMLEDYIEEGKKMMIREVIVTTVILIIAIVLCALFILHNWLVWIAFSFLSFGILGMLINSLSIKRWKFYKNEVQ
jgi:hypothetical protein